MANEVNAKLRMFTRHRHSLACAIWFVSGHVFRRAERC